MNIALTGSNITILSAEHRNIAKVLDAWEHLLQKHFHDNIEAQI